jgi:hypothetical protein
MRAGIVTCGILVGALWSAAFTPARATVPFHGGMSAAASALSDTILAKKGGRPCLAGSTTLSAGTLEERLVLTQLSVGVQGVQVVSGGRDHTRPSGPLYAMRAFGISANQ